MNKYLIAFLSINMISCSSLQFESESISSKRYLHKKEVIFTADDFGVSESINDGIKQGIKNGLINHVDAMVTFEDSTESIVALQREFPDLEIGLHLSITSGYPVSESQQINTLIDENGNFFSIDKIITRLEKIDVDELELELRAQINELLNNNIQISSISSQHNILSIYTPFFDVVLKLASEFNIPMRSSIPVSIAFKQFDYAKTKIRGRDLALKILGRNPFLALRYSKYFKYKEMQMNQSKMDEAGVRHTSYLVDAFWGEPTAENLYFILTNLPEGTSEIVFHLGLNEKDQIEQSGIDKDYYLQREFELLIVTSPEVKRWCDILNIQVVGYDDLHSSS